MDGILFFILAILVVIFSIKLGTLSDHLSRETKFGSLFIGGIILAGITSLPEAVTCMTAVFINNPYLAIGDILGSNIFNIFIIAFFDIVFIRKRIMNKIVWKYVYILFLLIYSNVVIISFFIGNISYTLFNIGLPTLIIFICYVIYIFLISNIKVKEEDVKTNKSVRNVKRKFIITAIVMLLLSIALTICADYIVFKHPLFSSSVIGAFMLGITTSLPEVVTVYTLIKLNSYNLAISNILGSNMFNLLILGISDIVFRGRSIYLFSNMDNTMFAFIGLGFCLILVYLFIRKKTDKKLIYIFPSLLVILTYLYIWYLHFS